MIKFEFDFWNWLQKNHKISTITAGVKYLVWQWTSRSRCRWQTSELSFSWKTKRARKIIESSLKSSMLCWLNELACVCVCVLAQRHKPACELSNTIALRSFDRVSRVNRKKKLVNRDGLVAAAAVVHCRIGQTKRTSESTFMHTG